MSENTAVVRCPYCHERIELYVDPDTQGAFVEDCEVCCRPWQVTARREQGRLRVEVLPLT